MSISDSLQDFIGKYSVTGVLKERLEFEASQRLALGDQLAQRDLTIAKLSSENEVLKKNLHKAEAELKELHSTAPPMDLDMGSEITLAALMNHPSGIGIEQIFRDIAFRTTLSDALVWMNEFIEHGFVERVAESEPDSFRLTSAGRSYARKYFAPRK
jgi:hypothetical protein